MQEQHDDPVRVMRLRRDDRDRHLRHTPGSCPMTSDHQGQLCEICGTQPAASYPIEPADPCHPDAMTLCASCASDEGLTSQPDRRGDR